MVLPFIKLIQVCTGYYFYDVNKNEVVKVNEKLYKALQRMMKFPEEQVDNQDVFQLQKEGYLSNKRPSAIKHPLDDFCEDYINNLMFNPILQITQKCNFRCRYCCYSGDGSLDRVHGKKSMTWETAKKALDYSMSRNKYSQQFSVSFYGGEPLLEFPLIKKCVNYVNEKLYGKEISYNLTTNISCLTKEMIAFFIKNNFDITLSIDGPEEIHDKNRKMASNGEGTFSLIMEKIRMINDISPAYLSKLRINCVWDLENDYDKIIDFFKNNSLLSILQLDISLVDTRRVDTSYQISEINNIKQEYMKVLSILWGLGYIKEKEKDMSFWLRSINDFGRKLCSFNEVPDLFHHNGPCLPGYRRLFVDIEGNYLPCEKVSNVSPAMKIGNVDDGIDMKKLHSMLNLGVLTEKECKNCWAMHFCDICLVYVDDNYSLSRKMKLNRCNEVKKQSLRELKEYIILRELGMPEGGFIYE